MKKKNEALLLFTESAKLELLLLHQIRSKAGFFKQLFKEEEDRSASCKESKRSPKLLSESEGA